MSAPRVASRAYGRPDRRADRGGSPRDSGVEGAADDGGVGGLAPGVRVERGGGVDRDVALDPAAGPGLAGVMPRAGGHQVDVGAAAGGGLPADDVVHGVHGALEEVGVG